MTLLHPIGADAGVPDLFELAGRNAERATVLLRDLLAAWPERAELAAELVACEHEGDRIAHDVIHRLHDGRHARRGVDPLAGYELATAIDDIVDEAEHTADMLGIYRVEAPMEHACLLGEVLVGAAAEVARALGALRDGTALGAHLVEIHRLENEGDRAVREATASLFDTGVDPMQVIRWKDIFERLEGAIDAAEHVADVLEGIVIKNS